EISRRLLRSKPAIQVASDARMQGVPRDLADPVDMVGEVCQRCHFWLRFRNYPTRYEHPGVEYRADHAAAFAQPADLLIRELPIPRNQCPAIVVAGPYRPLIEIQGLRHTFV